MTYPDDILKAAREAVAKVLEEANLPDLAWATLNGACDNTDAVKAACIAIMAERQAVATWLLSEEARYDAIGNTVYPRGFGRAANGIERGDHVKAANLGQQEKAGERT